MSTRLVGPCPVGARLRPWLGGWALLILFLHSACATGVPRGGGGRAGGFHSRSISPPPGPMKRATETADDGFAGAVVHELEVIEQSRVATRPVPLGRADFQRALQRFARDMHLEGTPQEAARELLKEHPQMEGEWLAEVARGHVLTLVPQDEGPLAPQADAVLRSKYEGWCQRRGWGQDCLHLFDDGPYLRADDRRTLALALCFGSVLEETREALGRELDPRALLAMFAWTAALYLGMWLVPEPTTKGAAAVLTLLLVAWLGIDTVWGLMDGWARLATRAHEATTFAELREAGEEYARVLGTDAARALIMAVATLTGRTLGEVAARVRSLPGYGLAQSQWQAQRGGVAALGQVEEAVGLAEARESALARAVEAVETVVATPQGPLAVVMLKKGAGRGTGAAPGGGSSATVLRHRGGNQQVVLGNGQRWHLPRGHSLTDIPAEDKVGDQLQEVVTRAANEWGPDRLSDGERDAITKALGKGKYWLARLLEREARGRFVHAKVEEQFRGVLKWNHQGVDMVDLKTGRKYEILSGTESNMARHGRRMASEFFRMLTF